MIVFNVTVESDELSRSIQDVRIWLKQSGSDPELLIVKISWGGYSVQNGGCPLAQAESALISLMKDKYRKLIRTPGISGSPYDPSASLEEIADRHAFAFLSELMTEAFKNRMGAELKAEHQEQP